MDPITFQDMFFSVTSASNLVLCLMIPHSPGKGTFLVV